MKKKTVSIVTLVIFGGLTGNMVRIGLSGPPLTTLSDLWAGYWPCSAPYGPDTILGLLQTQNNDHTALQVVYHALIVST